MTKETSQSCAEKIAELEPRLRALVEAGASDDEVFEVHRALTVARARVDVLFAREQRAAVDRTATESEALRREAEAAVEAVRPEVFHAARIATIQAAAAALARSIAGLSDDEEERSQKRREAYDLTQRTNGVPWPPHGYVLSKSALQAIVINAFEQACGEANVGTSDRTFLPLVIPRGDR